MSLTADSKPRMEDVAGKLSCFCGTCPHLVVTQCGCSTADQIKAEVQKKIDAGMTETQIIDSFVAQYGQTVLSAPPKRGFELTAWMFPFLAFFLGAGLLVTFLKRQRKETISEESQASAGAANEIDGSYRERLEKELAQRK
jgi:cytochrome c-type biogenesis protein CcmH